MKNTALKLLCAAALIAVLPLAGCTDMNKGNKTTDEEVEIQQQSEEEVAEEDGCPDCPDGEDKKDGCPDCGEKRGKRRGRFELPRGDFRKHGKRPVPPKKPVEPPEDDVVLPDPPVEDELPN